MWKGVSLRRFVIGIITSVIVAIGVPGMALGAANPEYANCVGIGLSSGEFTGQDISGFAHEQGGLHLGPGTRRHCEGS
jgi:hypothetical protein